MNGIASKTLIEMIWSLDKNMIPSSDSTFEKMANASNEI
jgi:hypothetical protein